MEAKDFAERFTSYRRDNGLTQEDVAEHLGITKAAVSKWECGHSFPDMSLMPEIASLFTISLDDSLGTARLWTNRRSMKSHSSLSLCSQQSPKKPWNTSGRKRKRIGLVRACYEHWLLSYTRKSPRSLDPTKRL